MGSVQHVDGREAEHGEYMDVQVALMSRNAEQLLLTGPEQFLLSGQEWKYLDSMKRNGLRDREAYDGLRTQEIISYLFQYWINRYAKIVGPLARINETPIEVVETLVSNFQSRVNEAIGQLRYLWQEHSGSVLSLQSALEQVRWNGPSVVYLSEKFESAEGEGHPFFEVSALLPYVQKDGVHAELLFDSKHIAHSTFIEPLRVSVSEAVQRDVGHYV